MIIVFGATGQVGKELLSIYYSSGEISDMIIPLSSKQIDLSKSYFLASFLQQFTREARLVINCSAFNDVDGMQFKEEKRRDGFCVNHIMPKALAENCQCPIIHISTDYVFDGGNNKDTDNPNPMSYYGESKLLGEQEILKHPHGYVFRTSSVYSKNKNNFVAKVIDKAKDMSDSLPFDFKKTIRLPSLTSSPNSARFVAEGIYKSAKAILNNTMPEQRLYHLTTDSHVSRSCFADYICNQVLGLSNGFSSGHVEFVDDEGHESLSYRPMISNLIFSSELKRIGIDNLHWRDDFCRYFMHDLFAMKGGHDD